MAQTFLPGMTNRNTGVSRREIQVFDPQAWQSRLRRDTWQVYTVCEWSYMYSVICRSRVKEGLHSYNTHSEWIVYSSKLLCLTQGQLTNWPTF